MKILLDECVPRKLKYALPGHECQTAPEAGFANKRNGVLLSLAEGAGFDIFLTTDKGIEYQQNLTGRRIAVIIVRGESNRLRDLLPHVYSCLAVIPTIRPGDLIRVGK